MRPKIILVILIVLISNKLVGQFSDATFILKYVGMDNRETDLDLIKAPNNKMDSLGLIAYVDKELEILREDGYINVFRDIAIARGDTLEVPIYLGKKYFFEYSLDSTSSSTYEYLIGNKGNISSKFIEKGEMENRILTGLGESGYPFATIEYDGMKIRNDTIHLMMSIVKNELVLFDTLDIGIDANISRKFVEKYLDINRNDVYDIRKIEKIRQRINELPFLKINSEPTMKFENGLARINLPLKNVKSNRFDFIIGVQPNTINGIRKWVITGDVTGEFQNLLSQGDYIFLNFKRLNPERQNLQLKFSMPFAFDLPIGPDLDFSLFKNENINLDINSELGIHYQLRGSNYLSMHWHLTRSRLIDVDTINLINTGKLPQNLDYDYQGGKVKLLYSDLDYRFNPTRGWEFNGDLSLGNRKIIRNATIEDYNSETLNFSEQYDSLALSNFQATLKTDISYYIPTADVGTIRLGISGLYKYSNTDFLTNELIRFGGNKDLRGFDEQNFLVDRYAMLSVEYRFILDKNSYLTLPFIQYARIHRQIEDQFISDDPIGVGLGISFTTPAGLFNVSFAAGKELNQGFDFNNTKVHFGYLSRF